MNRSHDHGLRGMADPVSSLWRLRLAFAALALSACGNSPAPLLAGDEPYDAAQNEFDRLQTLEAGCCLSTDRVTP